MVTIFVRLAREAGSALTGVYSSLPTPAKIAIAVALGFLSGFAA